MPTVKAIDTVVNIRTPRVMERRQHDFVLFESSLGKGKEPSFTLEETIEKMDRAGVEKSMLIAVKIGSPYYGFTDSVPYSFVEEAVAQYPDRFLGLAGVDPYAGMDGVRELEEAVKEPRLHRCACLPPLVPPAAGPSQVLPALRQVRRA